MAALSFRVLQHLLPRGAAFGGAKDVEQTWTIGDGSTIGGPVYIGGLSQKGPTLWRLWRGIADSFFDNVVEFANAVFLDAFPDTTRQLAEWEAQFGLTPNSDDATRRLNLAAEWASTGGQSVDYVQGVLQTAGFNVFVYDWFASGPPYTARNPNNYTLPPLIGTAQCAPEAADDCPACAGNNLDGTPQFGQFQCDDFLANDVHYLVNEDFRQRPPPAVPTDSHTWSQFMYIAGPSFPASPLPSTVGWATVPAARRDEFERLVLKLRPLHLWVAALVTYT